MQLNKFFETFMILEYISSNPNCSPPNVRDFLGIVHLSKPKREEKELYQSITKLNEEGYLFKVPIKKVGSGGAQYSLTLSRKGVETLSRLREFSSKTLRDKGRYPEAKSKRIMLDSMVKLFNSESFDIIFDLIEELLGERFKDATYAEQEPIINKLNECVAKLGVKASEIAESFF